MRLKFHRELPFLGNKPNKSKREGDGMLYIYPGYEKLSSPEETVWILCS